MPETTATPPVPTPTARRAVSQWDAPPAVPEHRWALARETVKILDALRLHLDCHAIELRDRWSDRGESWQESEQGGEVDTWIESLGDLVDILDNLERRI